MLANRSGICIANSETGHKAPEGRGGQLLLSAPLLFRSGRLAGSGSPGPLSARMPASTQPARWFGLS